jgi:hypothetical protein
MIRVVIDTNSLPRNIASPSAAFKRTMKLIQEGVIKVLMPHVVAEEWRTQQLEHLRKQLQKADEALEGLLGGEYMQGNADVTALTAAATTIEQAAAHGDAISHQSLGHLLKQLQTQVIAIAGEHGPRVAAAYFKGSSPFSGVKSRKDFPDAFLYEAVADLSGPDPADQVVAVTADKNLAKHLSSLPGVTRVETLEQLVESEQVKALAAKIALEAKWIKELPAVVKTIKEKEEAILGEDFIDSFIDALAHREVQHTSIPSDNRDATVSMVDDPKDIEIEWDEAQDYGPGVLRVPFSCTSDVLLDFYVYHSDAYGQPDFIRVQWADPEENHLFDAQADATAEVTGFISVTLKEWPGSMSPESIEVTVDEITDVELSEDDRGNALS